MIRTKVDGMTSLAVSRFKVIARKGDRLALRQLEQLFVEQVQVERM
jgi:hypothetical protein